MRPQMIPLTKLRVSRLNTRKDLRAGQEDSGIVELARNIQAKGLLSPLIVRAARAGRYEVIIGQRRLLACRRIGLKRVPCFVRNDLTDTEGATVSLGENVHRADMHPLDKARALKALYERCGSYEMVAKETTWSQQTVRKYIRLLGLPLELQLKVSTSEGPAKVAALARLATSFSGEEAIKVYEKIAPFRAAIQEEILKRAAGDISKIDELVEQAALGAFGMRRCGGAYRCELIREVVKGELGQTEFETLVPQIASNLGAPRSQARLEEAARKLWASLAKR